MIAPSDFRVVADVAINNTVVGNLPPALEIYMRWT